MTFKYLRLEDKNIRTHFAENLEFDIQLRRTILH